MAILQYLSSEKIVKLLFSVVLGIGAYLLLKIIVSRYLHRYFSHHIDRRIKQRVDTIERLSFSVIKLIVIIWFLFTFLDLLGLDIKALALSAGIAGLALSFGAQSLVKDLIGGFLMLIEGQFDLGDYVKIGDFSGIVFNISSRFVTLVNDEGALVQIPFGSITSIVNLRSFQEKICLENGKLDPEMFKKVKEKATKAGILFRFACIEDTGRLFFYFYGTALKPEFLQSIRKLVENKGVTVISVHSGPSACIIMPLNTGEPV